MQVVHIHTIASYAISFGKGEERGFEFFFNEFYPALCCFSNKIIENKEAAEEIASTAFMKIWERHERFSDAVSIRAYLYQIVRNDSLKFLRSKKRKGKKFKEAEYVLQNEVEKNHFDTLVKAETLRDIYSSIESLPSECKKVFQMLYVEGKSVKEISQQLNISVSTIKTQKARGMAVLRKKISAFILFLW